ncbi:MAG: matrixin family metalloprotease [Solirubrobacteraceae bacterium]
MDANGTRSRRRGLTSALVIAACALAGVGTGAPAAVHAAADSSGAAATHNLARFAVDSPAMVQAELIAVEYWNASPCGGVVKVGWTSLDPTVNATSDWWNPVAAYGNAAANTGCSIALNQDQSFDWPMFCSVMVHEIGHLTGHEHAADPASVMNPTYTHPIAQCTGSAPGAAAATPPATSTRSSAAGAAAHKAHSRAKTHKHHKKKRQQRR